MATRYDFCIVFPDVWFTEVGRSDVVLSVSDRAELQHVFYMSERHHHLQNIIITVNLYTPV